MIFGDRNYLPVGTPPLSAGAGVVVAGAVC